MYSRIGSCLLAGTAMIVPNVALAADDWSLELEAGALYDSQLAVEDVDLTGSQGDIAARLGAEIAYQPIDTDAFELELGYDLGLTFYEEFDEFNLQSHVADVSAATTVGGAKLGVRYAFSHYRLDGDALFDSHSITPSIAGFVTEGLYARAFYTYTDENYSVLQNGRDATNHQVGASLFQFFQDSAGFVSVSGRWEQENAVDPSFDYDGFNIGADTKIPLGGERDGPHVQLGAEYRSRDYSAITPSINAIRTEDRLRGEAELIFPISDLFRVETGYRYTDRSSNLPSADYVEHRASAAVVFEL